MSFWILNALRTILDTETDDESPGSEELMSQVRENIEALFILLLDTGVGGAIDSDPPDDTTGYLVDTGASFANDQHNNRTTLITSGLAKGNMYEISDTEAANNRIEHADDNLYADGVREADTYKILYDCLVNTTGHNHDDVNSAIITLPTGLASILAVEDTATEYTKAATGAGYTTYCTHYIYIPAGADTLTFKCRCKKDGTVTTSGVGAEISGSEIGNVAITVTSYSWGHEFDIDVSGLSSGWTTLEMTLASISGTGDTFLQGYSVAWKAT